MEINMREQEQRIYIAGMAGISFAAEMILLLFSFAKNKEVAIVGTAVIVVLFVLQTIWGYMRLQRVFHRIDMAGDVLAELVGESSRDHNEGQWQVWKERCEQHYRQGALGRLYEQIWEAAQVFWERERGRRKEQKYLRDLMDDISHQMKTPLASLQVFVDIFQKEVARHPSSEELTALAMEAEQQMERMRWLVTGMLKLAQVESGMMQFEKKEQPVLYTIEKSVAALRVMLEEKDLRVVISGNRRLLLRHDVDWLQEALVNLIKNAGEYAPPHSDIQIMLEETSIATVISVEDQGPGIEPTELPKIFNRFYCIRRKGGREGVGIGLSLAKSIIESQGGMITVYSQTEKPSYTRFVVTFLK